MDLLALAIDCARHQAIHGGLPRSWEELGTPVRARVKGTQFLATGILLSGTEGLEWRIGRRGIPK